MDALVINLIILIMEVGHEYTGNINSYIARAAKVMCAAIVNEGNRHGYNKKLLFVGNKTVYDDFCYVAKA